MSSNRILVAAGLLLLGTPVALAVQSTGQNLISQHVFAIPTSGSSRLNVSLPSPVDKGDLLVVGAVFHSVDVGRVTDSFNDSFSGQVQDRSNHCYPCAPDLGTGIWWSLVSKSGPDTVSVASLNSTELVEVFVIHGADPSTVGYAGGGGWGSTPGLDAVTVGQEVHDGNAFVLVIGGSVCEQQNSTASLGGGLCQTGQEVCYPMGPIDYTPAQSTGFRIEPYCGTKSPFSTGLLFGEYGVGNNTGGYTCTPRGNGTACVASGEGFTEDLGVNPPLAGSVLGQVFYVDPSYTTSGPPENPVPPILTWVAGAGLVAAGLAILVVLVARRPKENKAGHPREV